MLKVSVLYWQSIPSLVEIRDGKTIKKRQLSSRYQELIDMVAMRKKLVGTDSYLEQWRKVSLEDRVGDAESVLNDLTNKLENEYEEIRASAIKELSAIR